jgi:hypothetical protein
VDDVMPIFGDSSANLVEQEKIWFYFHRFDEYSAKNYFSLKIC